MKNALVSGHNYHVYRKIFPNYYYSTSVDEWDWNDVSYVKTQINYWKTIMLLKINYKNLDA